MLIYTIIGILLALWFISVEYQDTTDDYYTIGYEQILLSVFIVIIGPAVIVSLFIFFILIIVTAFLTDVSYVLPPIHIKIQKKIQEDDV